jgi:hypothetical protein
MKVHLMARELTCGPALVRHLLGGVIVSSLGPLSTRPGRTGRFSEVRREQRRYRVNHNASLAADLRRAKRGSGGSRC